EPPIETVSPAAEPDIEFRETEKPAKSTPVKHVKVRSTIDVMAELEALRKRATTQTTPKAKKESSSPPHHRGRELIKAATINIPPLVLPQTKRLKVTVSFENSDGGVVQEQQQVIELEDTADVESVSVN